MIEKLREQYEINKDEIEKFKVYLVPVAQTKNGETEIYRGYISLADHPLYAISAFRTLKAKIMADANGEPVIDQFTGKPREIKVGDTNIQLESLIGDFEELNDKGKPFNQYGSITTGVSSKQEEYKSAKFKGFELRILGDTVIKLDLTGLANSTGAIALKSDSYSLDNAETTIEYMQAQGSKQSPAVFKSKFEPLEAGWSWEDLIEFAKSLSENFPEYEEFIKTNFPNSKIEKRLVKLSPAAEALLAKVETRKASVKKLADTRTRQLSLSEAKSSPAIDSEDVPF